VTEYPQDWLLNPLEAARSKYGEMILARLEPLVVGGIGTHVEHLARYVTGLEIELSRGQSNRA
jgi:hypothetical protein